MKALNIIKKALVWLVILLAVFMMVFTVVSVNVFNRNDRSLFGYKMFVVASDSMKATDFDAGALILVKEADPSTLEEGDIITFISQNPESMGEVVTHKIRKLTTDANGNPGFVTYGTTTDTDDLTIVAYNFVLGQYKGHIPGLGYFFDFLRTTPGYFVCIFIPFMLIIVYQGIRLFHLFRTYKKEQMAEMQAEKEQLEAEKKRLEAERAEAAKMLEEIRAFKAQMGGQTSAVEVPTAEVAETSAEPQEAGQSPANDPSSEAETHQEDSCDE